jgi:acetolactate decarboxylase
MMRDVLIKVLLVSLIFIFAGCTEKKPDRDVIYQVSVVGALSAGMYDGDITIAELKEQGDFGIGTLNGFDGEMAAFDGEFYTVRADGVAYPVGDDEMTPFAVVTFFDPDRVISIDNETDLEGLKVLLEDSFRSRNIFYAIRVDGDFSYMKTRAGPKQEKPYPPLAEAKKDQRIFELKDVRGTIAGFFSPEYAGGITIPGYHLHFITDSGDAGGHVVECIIRKATAAIDDSDALLMTIPEY